MTYIKPLEEVHVFFNKMTSRLVRFRKQIEKIKETGDVAHDEYLINLKKLIDNEIIKPKPDFVKVMSYILLHRIKFECLGIIGDH